MPRRIIRLSRHEAKAKRAGTEPGAYWRIAVDPETLEARIVCQTKEGFEPDVEGHGDLFPLARAFERDDGYLEGGD